MNGKQSIYTLTISTPDGVIHVPIQHRVVNENDDNMQTTISVTIEGHEMCFNAETTEVALIDFAKELPSGWSIKSCLSCRYGHFCPVGNTDNELFCVTEFEPKEISDLRQVTEDDAERNKRSRNLFHLCEQYLPQASDYFTYSDYLSKVKHMKYGVKLMYTYAVGEQDRRFYEVSVLLIRAESFDDALEKAEAYGKNYCHEYVNPNNETVKTLGFEVLDSFLVYEEENGIQEVYSSFHTNSGAMNENSYYELISSQCDEEELYALRNKKYNS